MGVVSPRRKQFVKNLRPTESFGWLGRNPFIGKRCCSRLSLSSSWWAYRSDGLQECLT